MRGLLAFLAILAMVFGPVAAGARACAHVTAAAFVAMADGSMSHAATAAPCAEHMAKKKAADAKCATACAATVSVGAIFHGSDISAPAQLGLADMAMAPDRSAPSVAGPLLDRPPKPAA